MIRYEYRLTAAGALLGEQFLRLRDVEGAAEWLAEGGVQARIEHRHIEPDVTEWAPLAWEDTLAGRLGYERFPGYGGVDLRKRRPRPVVAGESGE